MEDELITITITQSSLQRLLHRDWDQLDATSQKLLSLVQEHEKIDVHATVQIIS